MIHLLFSLLRKSSIKSSTRSFSDVFQRSSTALVIIERIAHRESQLTCKRKTKDARACNMKRTDGYTCFTITRKEISRVFCAKASAMHSNDVLLKLLNSRSRLTIVKCLQCMKLFFSFDRRCDKKSSKRFAVRFHEKLSTHCERVSPTVR